MKLGDVSTSTLRAMLAVLVSLGAMPRMQRVILRELALREMEHLTPAQAARLAQAELQAQGVPAFLVVAPGGES